MKERTQSFWDTLACLTLALWLFTLPVTVLLVGSLSGLWPAGMVFLTTVVVVLPLPLALCRAEGANGLQT
ncbi:MAG: hypothetical protein ACE5IQ_04460 [Candidatus Methylomirabilales bacterium]